MRSRLAPLRWVVASALALSMVALGTGSASAGTASAKKLPATTLNASGATFPQAYYQEAMAAFKKVQPNVTINYSGGGSGTGRTDFANQVKDFAGSDAPFPAADLPKIKGGEFLYFPTVVAPITVAYNLPSVSKLQLSGPTISKIFRRVITKWDDPAIKAENTGVTLPSTNVTVARRSDSSGTTQNFTSFLAKSDPAWTVTPLNGASAPTWATDTQGGAGNAGVTAIVKGTEGAIGYVDFSDAKAGGLKFAAVKNQLGKYVDPSVKAASEAAATVAVNADLTYDPIWATGPTSYPITAPTWLLVYKTQTDAAKGAALKAFLEYLYGKGQKLAPTVDYAPLAGELLLRAKAQVKTVQGV
jgi:phosphate transport system substrate-binding protein